MTDDSANENTRVRRKYRLKKGTKSLREIKKYQNSTDLLMQKVPFNRIVREVASDLGYRGRFSGRAMTILQETAEMYATDILSRANKCAIHSGRTTIFAKDIQSLEDVACAE